MNQYQNPLRVRLAQELRHNRPLQGCRFDPTGRFVFAGGEDNTVSRWDLASGTRVALTGHRSWIRALAFQEDRVFSGDYNGRVLTWTAGAANPTPVNTLEAHDGWVR